MKINLVEYLEATAVRIPDRVAVRQGEVSITFSELRSRALSLADVIVEKLSGRLNQPIAVFLPKSIDSVAANLAIMYSGNFYMNLDVKSPEKRIGNILHLIQPSVILTSADLADKLKTVAADGSILVLDESKFSARINSDLLFKRLEQVIDTDPACIINTSGSTGTPKGVVLNHRSFFDFTEWAIERLEISDAEIIGSLSPLVFDIYSFELCMLMARGSTMILIPESLSAFPVNILKLLRESQVSFIFWVPTIMVNISNMDLLSKMSLPDLKTVWFAGEIFPTRQFNYWRKHIPLAKFVNLYGPIEITLDCTYYIIERELKDNEPIPIGFACRNTHVLILNDADRTAGINEPGELCVRGSSLAMGYFNNPEKTQNAFVQNPLNSAYPELIYRTGDIVFTNELGEIIFKGRKDSMVKHLGYRIELSEIEHVIINQLKLVKNGCVIYDFSKKEIVLFYEADQEISVPGSRKEIATVFPKYMIPNLYVKMDELPRNTNGKIDRLLLSQKVNA